MRELVKQINEIVPGHETEECYGGVGILFTSKDERGETHISRVVSIMSKRDTFEAGQAYRYKLMDRKAAADAAAEAAAAAE